MKIFTKLMLVLFLTSFLLLSAIFSLLQWGFDRGMLNYVNQKELDSLQLLSDNLSRYYQDQGSWSLLQKPPLNNKSKRPAPPRKEPKYRSNEKRSHGERDKAKPRRFEKHRPDKERGAKHPKAENDYWPLILFLSESGIVFPQQVVSFLKQNETLNDFGAKRPPRDKGVFDRSSERDHGRATRHESLHPSLLGKHKEVIIGRFNEDFVSKEIVLNGEIIGYLALPPKKHLTDAFDLAFIEKSQQIFLWSFLVLLLLITLIAIPFSRHFIKPIKSLEKSMALLNRGVFDVKLAVSGKDELASLSLNFNDLALTLKQNEVSRNKWLADISHELRTPLAIIKGEIEAIEDGIRPMNITSLLSLKEETEHLQKLINDLAELSNAEIGAIRYQKQKINIVELIKHNLLRHQVDASNKGLKLQFAPQQSMITVWADPTRINQVIDNLVNNSIKYTDGPGMININLMQRDDHAVLNIEDSAPTVSKTQLTKLFEHLYRVESSRNRKTGGSGIGLALCKKIIEAHQGRITAQQSTLGGLCIRCELAIID